MSELPIQKNSHIFTNKNGNTLMREFEVRLNESHHLCDLVQYHKHCSTSYKRCILEINDWHNDYKDVQSFMIYGEKPSFEELMRKMSEL